MINKKTNNQTNINAEKFDFVSEETAQKKQEVMKELIAKLSDEQFELFQKYLEVERVYTKEYCARFATFLASKANKNN